MTPSNVKRLKILSDRILKAAKENAPAAVMMLQIFDWQEELVHIASDLHMRAGANDESEHP